MASSQVQMASAHFGCVLRDHNWRHTDKERESNDSVRAQQLEKNLKDFVRDHIKSCIALSGSRDSDENSENQVDNQEKNDHNFKGPGRREEEPQFEDESSPLAMKHSRIVDRWATRKAREMIITIERQTHEAELLALSNSHPVSTVASSFVAESPRTPSECSVELPNLHTSSLLQMWREFESEKKPTSGNHISFTSNSTISSGGRLDSGTSNPENAFFVDDPSPRSEVCDSGDERYETPAAHEDSFTDWESEQNTASEQLSSSQERVSEVGRLSEVGESERPRVADIVRKLTSGKPMPTHSSMTPSSDEPDQEQPTVIDPVPEGGEQRGFLNVGKSPRVRGRQAMMDLLMQMERERQRELNELVERRAVSQFAQRGRIQSMLKLRLLQRGVATLDQQSPASAASELGRLQQGTNILALRRKFSPYREAGEVHGGESGGNSNSHTQLPDNTTDLGHSGASDEVINEEVHHQEVARMDQESTTPMHHLVPSIREDMQEEASQSIDYARQGTCSMVCDLAQEGSINNMTSSHDSEGNELTEEREPDTEQLVGSTDGTWLGDASHPHKNWRGSMQSWYQDLLPNNSEDGEWNVVTDAQEPGMQQFRGSTNGTWLGDVSSSQSGWRHSRQAWQEDVLDNNSEDRERIFVTEEPESDMLQLAESADGTWLSNGLHPQTDWRGQSWYQNALENNSEDEEGNVVTDEPDLDSEQLEGSTDGTWLGDVSRPPRDWRRSRQEWCQEVLENNSENGEIRELLQRRSVSRFLASDLRETMDQMIMSCIQRQRHQSESVAEEENHFEHPYSETSGTSDHFASTSFNLPLSMSYNLPLPYQLRPQNWYQDHEATRDNSEQAASTSLQPSEYQSRDNMQSAINHPSLLHNEIYELRKSMESCMDMQNKIQHSIKKEVSAAVYNSVHGGEATELRNWVPTTKGKCCICYDMQVDSLLYRCGHMCTCFKCAHELQWSSGRCPICRAPILDVVRAYSNS
ncbi:uncharacterized protein LOC122094177 isoform X2 [Macadamia integrifolia]|uniref:uncharacterized protein LOC122094177 isoform X2 n=1 Tax=Macadamia integrifolia TaxID=60698 RepID=UPI001C533307|nr:uncharacterized protein LOC122094177 isoform X2 [Macadamia integrifolia]